MPSLRSQARAAGSPNPSLTACPPFFYTRRTMSREAFIDDPELSLDHSWFSTWVNEEDARSTPIHGLHGSGKTRSRTPVAKTIPTTTSTHTKRKSADESTEDPKSSLSTSNKKICIVDGCARIDVADSRLAAAQRVAHAAGRNSSLKWRYEDTTDELLGAFCDGHWFAITELKSLTTF